jgi:protease-4
MAKFLVGVLVGVIVAVLAIVVVIFAIGRIFAARQPTLAADSVLVLSLTGDLPETAPVEVPIPFLQSASTPTVRDVWASLRNAATDNRIKAIVVEPYNLVAGWGKMEELRQELLDFKKSGKPVYALLQAPGSREYYLASAADKIYLSPDDLLNVKGFRVAELYFKNALDKLGVSVDVDHIGAYKDAGDIFTRTNMSPETREVLGQVVDQLYGDFSSTIAQARHKSADDIHGLIDQGPFLADQAKTDGLIDQTGYEDQVYSDLEKATRTPKLNKVNIKTYFRAVSESGDRIAMLAAEGDIIRAEGKPGLGTEAVIASGPFIKTIRQIREDRSIKGVILRIDSPGGDATASDEILRELKLLSAAKPMVVSMSDVAASGGYYMASTGDPIVAYPDTITGSIGVLYVKPNIHGLFDKLGISEDAITRGKMADVDSVYTPLSDAGRQKLHESIQDVYDVFVSKVASARKKTFAQIDPIAQGRVWMGAQARDNGLVDQLGGLDQAIALVRQKAHLPANGATNLILYPPRRSLLDVLTSSSTSSIEDEVTARDLRKKIPGLPGPAMLEGGMLQILPYQFTVQ